MCVHISVCLRLKVELNTMVRSLPVCSFFPLNKAVIHLKCNYASSASISLLVPSHSDVFFFIFEYWECPNHSKSQNYRNINYPPLPHHAPYFPVTLEVTSLSCYVETDSFATPWTVALQDLLSPWDFPGRNTGVGCHSLLQGIFPTPGSNPGVLHWSASSLLQDLQGRPANLSTFWFILSIFICKKNVYFLISS